jgi:hypothetical protein
LISVNYQGLTEEESDHLDPHEEQSVYETAQKEDKPSHSVSQEGQVSHHQEDVQQHPLEPNDRDGVARDHAINYDGQDAPEESTQQAGDEGSIIRRAQRPVSNALSSYKRLLLALQTFDA